MMIEEQALIRKKMEQYLIRDLNSNFLQNTIYKSWLSQQILENSETPEHEPVEGWYWLSLESSSHFPYNFEEGELI